MQDPYEQAELKTPGVALQSCPALGGQQPAAAL